MLKHQEAFVWLDLEMTGLNIEHHKIIEIATIITNNNLEIIATGPVYAIWQPDVVLEQMDDWNKNQHHTSGLINRVKTSDINEAIAEQTTLEFLAQYFPAGVATLCGNSIWQDRRFLERYMPMLAQYFHYRMIDVSTVKELAQRWAPEIYSGMQKNSAHLASEDIKESIAELAYYRAHWLSLNQQ